MAFKPHMPTFGYPVTRPYPYKWFNWVVLIGGIIATVLLSLISFAADGYQLEVKYTTDPNGTVHEQSWTKHWPMSWFAKVSTTCQGQIFQVNSQFFTDKLSLPYIVTGIWQINSLKLPVILPSVQYMDNPLQNCSVNQMLLDIDSSSSRTANQRDVSEWGIKATAYVTCMVNNGDTQTFMNLTTTYDYVTPNLNANAGPWGSFQGSMFLQLDKSTRSSLWWGQSLLGWYYWGLARHVQDVKYDSNNNELLNKLTFRNEPRGNWTASNITDLMYFHNVDEVGANKIDPITGALIAYDSDTRYNTWVSGTNNTAENYLEVWPQIFPQADLYAKIFYSCILADLGNPDLENILTNPVLLQNYTSDFIHPNGSNVFPQWDYMGPAFTSYKNDQESDSRSGPLGIEPSTIYAEYFCQEAKPKPAGSLIVAIIIADLVFLQTLWKLLNWATTLWVEHSDSQATYCQGCVAMMDKRHELEAMGGPKGGGYASVSSVEVVMGRDGSLEREREREPLT